MHEYGYQTKDNYDANRNKKISTFKIRLPGIMTSFSVNPGKLLSERKTSKNI